MGIQSRLTAGNWQNLLNSLVLGLATLSLIAVFWVGYTVLTARFIGQLQEQALNRANLEATGVAETLQSSTTLIGLATRDSVLIEGLTGARIETTQAHLVELRRDIGVRALLLYTVDRRLIGSTDPLPLEIHASAPYFDAALEADQSVFATIELAEVPQRFLLSRRIVDKGRILGVLIAELDLARVQRVWAAGRNQVYVTDSSDRVLLTTQDSQRYKPLTPYLTENTRRPNLLERWVMQFLWGEELRWKSLINIDGLDYLPIYRPLDFRGWSMAHLTPVQEARAQANAILASVALGVAVLAAFIFYIGGLRSAREALRIRREKDELSTLNSRLTQEIEERRRVEQSLAIAERSLEHSSKLAALGQMSAAVAHELNQPLAAMRTYIAAAQLLLKRNRTDEAMTSFQRIDDLITRMNALTQQLKSFARQGPSDLIKVDLRHVMKETVAIMSPQIGQRNVAVKRLFPADPVYVRGDPLRLEQIFINLMRNAMDATQAIAHPAITLEVIAGETLARVIVRDNGPGITGDPSQLFEPFYTTKNAGDGVGLGLAISSQIAEDLGGALTARNAPDGGAVFEFSVDLAENTTRE